MSFWARDVTAWQVSPPGAGGTTGCGVCPDWGLMSSAGAATMGRDAGALQDGLLGQGLELVYSQEQGRILA